jgi:hypothetical protein
LRCLMTKEGYPCREQLLAIGDSADFKAAVAVDQLNFKGMVERGIPAELVERIDTELKRLRQSFYVPLNTLESLSARIERLTPADLQPHLYGQRNAVQEIEYQIACAPLELKELAQRLQSFKRLVAKVYAVPRQVGETWRPAFPQPGRNNPTAQVTEA